MARPKNPYADARWGIVPDETHAWLESHLRNKPMGSRPSEEFFKGLPDAITRILAADLPRPMRYVEALLTFRYCIRPDDVNEAISTANDLVQTPMQIGEYPRPAVILSYRREPSVTEFNTLRRMYERFRRSIDTKYVGKTAEYYVHGVLTQSGAYHRMRRKKVGHHHLNRKHKLDLLVIEKSTAHRFGISIKNLRSYIFPGHRAFPDLLKMAEAHGVFPWLIASFLTPEAKAHAVRLGMRWTELKRQIMPLTMPDPEDRAVLRDTKTIIEKARHVIGPVRYEYVPHKRFPPRATWEHDLLSGVGLDTWTIPDEPLVDGAFLEKLFVDEHAEN